MRAIVGYASVLIAFVAIDAVWLGWVARDFYRERMGDLMAGKPNLIAAAAFYLLYPVGLTIFALLPALDAQSWATALLRGALFGLFAYATYDLTNLAVIRGWSLSLSLVDMAWGAALSGVAVLIGYAALRIFMPNA